MDWRSSAPNRIGTVNPTSSSSLRRVRAVLRVVSAISFVIADAAVSFILGLRLQEVSVGIQGTTGADHPAGIARSRREQSSLSNGSHGLSISHIRLGVGATALLARLHVVISSKLQRSKNYPPAGALRTFI